MLLGLSVAALPIAMTQNASFETSWVLGCFLLLTIIWSMILRSPDWKNPRIASQNKARFGSLTTLAFVALGAAGIRIGTLANSLELAKLPITDVWAPTVCAVIAFFGLFFAAWKGCHAEWEGKTGLGVGGATFKVMTILTTFGSIAAVSGQAMSGADIACAAMIVPFALAVTGIVTYFLSNCGCENSYNYWSCRRP